MMTQAAGLLFLHLVSSLHPLLLDLNRTDSDKVQTVRRLQSSCLLAAAAAAAAIYGTLWDPIDGSPLGSSIPGILQARTLEWVAISFSRA